MPPCEDAFGGVLHGRGELCNRQGPTRPAEPVRTAPDFLRRSTRAVRPDAPPRSHALGIHWVESTEPGPVRSPAYGDSSCEVPLKRIEEVGLPRGVTDVVDIPEARLADGCSRRLPTEPGWRCRVDRCLGVVAEQRDRCSLDHSTLAGGTRGIINLDLQERHRPNAGAHVAFKRKLDAANLQWRGRAAAPRLRDLRRVVARGQQRLPNVQSEDGSSVVSTAGEPSSCRSTMLRQAPPESALRRS